MPTHSKISNRNRERTEATRRDGEKNSPKEYNTCVCICVMMFPPYWALGYTYKDRKISLAWGKIALYGWQSGRWSQSVNFVKLGVADEDGKCRKSMSVCYRVGLRGLAQRLCLPWIPRAVEIPQQPQPPSRSAHHLHSHITQKTWSSYVIRSWTISLGLPALWHFFQWTMANSGKKNVKLTY